MIRVRNIDNVFEFTLTVRYWFTQKQYCDTCDKELYPLRPQENTFTCMNPSCIHVRLPVIRIDS